MSAVPKRPCEVAASGDTTLCRRCWIIWDTNDPCPPVCGWRPLEHLEGCPVALLEEVDLMIVGLGIAYGIATIDRGRGGLNPFPVKRVRRLPPAVPVGE